MFFSKTEGEEDDDDENGQMEEVLPQSTVAFSQEVQKSRMRDAGSPPPNPLDLLRRERENPNIFQERETKRLQTEEEVQDDEEGKKNRVVLLFGQSGSVDSDLWCSSIIPILEQPMHNLAKGGTAKIIVKQSQLPDQMNHPVLVIESVFVLIFFTCTPTKADRIQQRPARIWTAGGDLCRPCRSEDDGANVSRGEVRLEAEPERLAGGVRKQEEGQDRGGSQGLSKAGEQQWDHQM